MLAYISSCNLLVPDDTCSCCPFVRQLTCHVCPEVLTWLWVHVFKYAGQAASTSAPVPSEIQNLDASPQQPLLRNQV